MKRHIEKCLAGEDLTADEAAQALDAVMTGCATDIQIAGLLIALRAKGESVQELVGFARTMRQKAVHITVDDPDAIDMCGTGGDYSGTFNISTVSCFVAAGAGVTVAKHGNRSVSSRSGSADLLRALGVNIETPPERVKLCINEIGIGFLFAPMFHPAMKYAARPRAELGIRTIFNILGPLTNPAGVRKQLVGVFDRRVASDVADALTCLGAEHACVVHSNDGLDEVTVAGETSICEVGDGAARKNYAVTPETFGMKSQESGAMKGGTAEENAAIALSILGGNDVPGRNVVTLNAAFGIYVSGMAADLREGVELAEESIDSGRARKSLERLIEYTTRP